MSSEKPKVGPADFAGYYLTGTIIVSIGLVGAVVLGKWKPALPLLAILAVLVFITRNAFRELRDR